MHTKRLAMLSAFVVLAVVMASCATPTPEKVIVTQPPVEVTRVVAGTPEVVVVTATPAPVPEEKEEITLRILSLAWPQTPVEQELADKYFTPKTGIKVEITGPPYEFVESKVREICASQSSEYDLFEYDSQWYGGAVMNGCFEPLDPYFEQAGLDYDSMFVQPYATYNGRWPVPVGVLTGEKDWQDYTDVPLYFIPWTIGTMILSYQPELFVEAGIVDEDGNAKPPDTWEEMLDAAKKLTVDTDGDGKIDRYGMGWYACRISDGITQQWLPFHVSYGAKFWDEETWQAEGICLYAEIRRRTYLLVCSLLGLLHWRALDLNPMLVWEDLLVHEEPPACLCAHRDTVQEYALAFENPYICKPCREFFRCLGLESDGRAIQDVLDYLVRERSLTARVSL